LPHQFSSEEFLVGGDVLIKLRKILYGYYNHRETSIVLSIRLSIESGNAGKKLMPVMLSR
jgi:hypothetical protein